jgi:hypothetical protein
LLRRLPLFLLLALAVALPVACHRQPPGPLPRGVESITADAMLDDVTVLAGPEFSGRLAGSPGYEAAARWAAHRLDRLGLEPGGDDDSFLQRLPIECNIIQGTPRFSVTDSSGATTGAVLGSDFTCRGFTGSGSVEAPVVFAGYGLSVPERGYDDYAGLDVAGKVVLVFKPNPGWNPDSLGWDWAASTPRAKAATARRHGAVAMLWFDPPGDDPTRHRGPIGSVLHGPGEHLADMPQLELDAALADRLLGAPGEGARRRAVIDSLQAPRSQPLAASVAIEVEASYEPARETCNVVAVLPGSDPELAEEALVIGAHLDHVGRQSPEVYFPGANDNASGAAAVLQLAEAFRGMDRAPRRSVVFVLFAGEESGLVGSRFHAEHPLFPPERTTAMFNLDCVAHGDSIRIGGGESAPELWQLARAIDAEHARLTTTGTWAGGGADASPFFERGIRTLYWVTTNSYTHLHAASDTPETLNGDLYEDLVRLAFRTAWEVADAPAEADEAVATR